MTRNNRIAKSESNLIRGLLAIMVLVGCASTQVQNMALERQLQDDKQTYATHDRPIAGLVAKL